MKRRKRVGRSVVGWSCAIVAGGAIAAWADAPATAMPATTHAASTEPTTQATTPATSPATQPSAPTTQAATTPMAIEIVLVERDATRASTRPATQPTTATVATRPAVPEIVRAVSSRNFGRQSKRVLEAVYAPASTQPTTMPSTQESPSLQAERFERDVVTGHWSNVATFLATLLPAEADPIYLRVLDSLAGTGEAAATPEEMRQRQMMAMQMQQQGQSMPQPAEAVVLPEDVLALADAYPFDPTPAHTAALGKLLGASLRRGEATTRTLAAITRGLRHYGGADPANRRRAADLLMAAGLDAQARPFLPPLPADTADVALLADTARTLTAEGDAATQSGKHVDDSVVQEYRRIYEMFGYTTLPVSDPSDSARPFAPQHAAALAIAGRILQLPTIDASQRAAALDRATSLLEKVEPRFGDAFIRRLVTDRPDAVGTLVTAAGASAAQRLNSSDVAGRAAAMRMQQRIVAAILDGPGDATPVAMLRPAFDALAMNWLAEVKAAEAQPSAKDRARGGEERLITLPGGGMTYVSRNMGRQAPPTVDEAKLLDAGPQQSGGRWMAACDPSLRGAISRAVASLLIRDEQIQPAMAAIEQLAEQEPAAATDYAGRLLQAWARVANPNPTPAELEEQQQAQMRGYSNQSAGVGIALTRVRQDRNLAEMAALLERMRKLPGGAPSIGAITDAFVKAHSDAEVYRPDAVQAVFGPVAAMDQDALGTLLGTMRQRLSKQWRQPQVQQQAGTKRDDKAIAAEVDRGYQMIVAAVDASQGAKGVHWKTEMTAAAALFDWNEFKYGRGLPLAEYTARRDESFARFKNAAEAYRASIVAGTLPQQAESIDPFMNWFLAALGASDLAQLTRQQTPQLSQVKLLKASMAALPGEAAQRHLTMFAQTLSDQTKTISPELKYRYFQAGIDVVGDEPKAKAARDLVAYYNELLQEVEFVAQLDGGSTTVGTKPFGVHLGIRHTEAMGRESGGFGRYLTTPNASQSYYPQQPSAVKNDRERVEKNLRESLSESFEIVSITWHAADITPRGDIENKPGWRYTPLAFVLLKVRDAAIDRIPPVRLDLDFRDGGNRVVLPVQSSVLAVDAKTERPADAAKLESVTLSETLDESEAADRQLTLDVRASGNGLLPELADLVDLSRLAPWTIEKTGDGVLSVAGLDLAGDAVRPQTSRSWILTLKAPADAKVSSLASFRFPILRDGVEVAKDGVKYQRYSGSDLVATDASIELGSLATLQTRATWRWRIAGALLITALVAGFAWWLRRRKPVGSAQVALDGVTPFSLVALLRRLEADRTHRGEPGALRTEIERLERKYFGRDSAPSDEDDLRSIAERWRIA